MTSRMDESWRSPAPFDAHWNRETEISDSQLRAHLCTRVHIFLEGADKRRHFKMMLDYLNEDVFDVNWAEPTVGKPFHLRYAFFLYHVLHTTPVFGPWNIVKEGVVALPVWASKLLAKYDTVVSDEDESDY